MSEISTYILRIEFDEDQQDKIPFGAFGDRDAVVKGLDAVLNFAKHFNVTNFVIDTMVVGCVIDGEIRTNYPVRLFDAHGDMDLNLLEDHELPTNHQQFLSKFRSAA